MEWSSAFYAHFLFVSTDFAISAFTHSNAFERLLYSPHAFMFAVVYLSSSFALSLYALAALFYSSFILLLFLYFYIFIFILFFYIHRFFTQRIFIGFVRFSRVSTLHVLILCCVQISYSQVLQRLQYYLDFVIFAIWLFYLLLLCSLFAVRKIFTDHFTIIIRSFPTSFSGIRTGHLWHQSQCLRLTHKHRIDRVPHDIVCASEYFSRSPFAWK